MTMQWRPPGADPHDYEVVVDGIPHWLKPSLDHWVQSVFGPNPHRMPEWGQRIIREYDLSSRRVHKLAPGFDPWKTDRTVAAFAGDDEYLEFVDFLVSVNSRDAVGVASNKRLEEIFLTASSSHHVGIRNSLAGLERRVDAGAQTAAETVMTDSGSAGNFLADAWKYAFGRAPDPEKAYVKAILAVEAAAIPAVLKNDKSAILSKVIGQMRKDGDWSLPFDKEHSQNPSSQMILSMLQALMSGHSDRHPGEQFVPTSQAAAETAVLLAVPLVQWFHSGAIQRR